MIRKLFTLAFSLSFFGFYGQAIKVEVAKKESGYTLVRDGEPYYIRGAGGHDYLEELQYLGGNSIRTWSAEDAQEILDEAHKHGFTVMFGLWVQHERHGFDYNDEIAVQKQLERFTEIVRKYKDHPAILLWGVGNEVDLFYTNTKVWDAIQDICAMIHREDPNHPTSTVTAGLDSNEVHEILTRVPDLDIYGFNTYGDIARHSANIQNFGWDGPYIISEWGPNGHWEVEKTDWGAPIEQTSTEKAASYEKRYTEYIAKKKGECIGSYVFLWGQKQETTSTWYGLFTAEGNPTEPLDRLYVAWQNQKPPNSAPTLSDLKIEGKSANESIYMKAEGKYNASINFSDPDGDNVKVQWYVYPESNNTKAGGDFESALQPVLGTLGKRKGNTVQITAPKEEGGYRLFAFVVDKGKRAAYANIPFYVVPRDKDDPPSKSVRFKKRELQVERN
jgi:hypothetical protein